MTHEKFIELLNLYLDGELPPSEAVVLEREIAGSVERRRIYRQYCQMQNACAELAERFREEAAPAPHFRQGAVVELRQRSGGEWLRSLGLVASGAMAACAVFVAVRQFSSAPADPNVAQPQAAAVLASAPVVPFTTTVAAGANPAGFRNPWTTVQRDVVVDFNTLNRSPLTLTPSPVDFAKAFTTEDLKVDLKASGVAPLAPLRIDEIDATAFQYQR